MTPDLLPARGRSRADRVLGVRAAKLVAAALGDLTLGAVFRSGGHVGLTWTLRPSPTAAGGWESAVTTWLEAGEQMSALAADLHHFLHENWSDRG